MTLQDRRGLALSGHQRSSLEQYEHALELTEPVLILADRARAERLIAAGCEVSLGLDIDRPLDGALAPLLDWGEAELPEITPEDGATILFTSGSR